MQRRSQRFLQSLRKKPWVQGWFQWLCAHVNRAILCNSETLCRLTCYLLGTSWAMLCKILHCASKPPWEPFSLRAHFYNCIRPFFQPILPQTDTKINWIVVSFIIIINLKDLFYRFTFSILLVFSNLWAKQKDLQINTSGLVCLRFFITQCGLVLPGWTRRNSRLRK